MLKNYFIVAWRTLRKNGLYSLINISGLAIGLSCFLLIALYVLDEISYDRFNERAQDIYRINSDIRYGGSDLHLPMTSDQMGELLKKDYPQIEQYTRIYASSGSKLIKKGNVFISEQQVAHVDSTFFDVFTFPALAGSTHKALDEPNTVVITESAAKKYFGTTDVLGKTLETRDRNGTLYKITAVIRDMPENSHFNFDFLFSMKNVDYPWGQLTSHNFHTYLLLKKGTDYKAFEKNFDQYIDKYVLPFVKQFIRINNMEEFKRAGNQLSYSLIPLTKIHLYSDRSFELSAGGNIQYVYIFSAVALFILLIACINFMNLTTARSANRAREVGIRKVLGTERKNLIGQFLTESTLMALLSLLLALIVVYLVLPLFNNVAAKSMQLSSLFSWRILPLLVLLPVIVGLLAGAYPAFFLSAFKPIKVLKGNLNSGRSRFSLRSVLVVFQFATSIVLIVGTVVIYRQLRFIQTKDLGYNKSQVLIIDGTYALGGNTRAFKQELLQMNGVKSGTMSGFLPVSSSSRSDDTYSKDAVMDYKNGLDMQDWRVDYDYIETMGMEIVKGRNFSRSFGSDSSGLIINETTAGLLGYADPIGKTIYHFDNNKMIPFHIIGVVRNFNYESLRQGIGPLCFRLGSDEGIMSFRINTENIPGLVKQVEAKWKTLASGMPFSYRFLDQAFDEMYRKEQRVGRIALIFSVLAIVIACLGLFGLATFIAEQRTKEIGIRKVLGASVQGIVGLFSADFLKLVGVAFIISAPLAWWAMNKWLNDFAYRIEISWWFFGLAGLLDAGIALLTISFQAVRAALANPVRSLRSE
ncbi:MAG TPA: ABC transporter permease [Puia sp.]|nr:ABC transporter permease [Puia sp.]